MNAIKFAIPLFVALACGPSQGLAASILSSDLASVTVLGGTPKPGSFSRRLEDR